MTENTNLYQSFEGWPFDVVELGCQNEACPCADFPVDFVDGGLEDEDLEVDVGHGQGQQVEVARRGAVESYLLHLPLDGTQLKV